MQLYKFGLFLVFVILVFTYDTRAIATAPSLFMQLIKKIVRPYLAHVDHSEEPSVMLAPQMNAELRLRLAQVQQSERNIESLQHELVRSLDIHQSMQRRVLAFSQRQTRHGS
ncbi:MAG TPA: hypothetical protein VGT41_05380 [Candidatus Babeliales bacterium]|nr:hypothetical protein [Candidatus Babeliales bacterium]